MRFKLQREAERFSYAPEIKVVGESDRIVRTEYSSFETFPDTALHARLASAFQALMDASLAELADYPFSIPLQFNSRVLQRYELGQLGITPHRDSLRAINLVCIFNISGHAEFCLCRDRNGTDPIQIDTTPGTVIFMKAPGFLGSQERPFHYVTHIRSTRYSFGLRQKGEG